MFRRSTKLRNLPSNISLLLLFGTRLRLQVKLGSLPTRLLVWKRWTQAADRRASYKALHVFCFVLFCKILYGLGKGQEREESSTSAKKIPLPPFFSENKCGATRVDAVALGKGCVGRVVCWIVGGIPRRPGQCPRSRRSRFGAYCRSKQIRPSRLSKGGCCRSRRW